MTKATSYRLDSDGPAGKPAPPRGGIFQLSEGSWLLVFGRDGSGVRCGLLRSQVEVEATRRRRRCRVTVVEDGDSGFTATFVLRARADDVREDLRRRHESLHRAAEVIAAVEGGQWWRGADAFEGVGWSRTQSVSGVRCVGGTWETDGCRPTRRARVLDFGPGGVCLRGWRTSLRLPWESIAAIGLTDTASYSGPRPARAGLPDRGTVITVTGHSGEQAIFYTALTTVGEVRSQLGGPFHRLVDSPGVGGGTPSPADMPVGPMAVPGIPPR